MSRASKAAERRRRAAEQKEAVKAAGSLDIGVLRAVDDDGTIQVTLMNLNGPPSPQYRYSTRSGKLEKGGDDCPVEWIGSINVSPSYIHRVWSAVAAALNYFRIPTESEELEQFIAARGKNKSCYNIKFEDKTGSISLPGVSALAKTTRNWSDKSEAYIGNVAVAPARQRQGFGFLLHKLMASELKSLGYKKMLSDVVGLNTDAELAVWKALKKEARVTPFRESTSAMGFMHRMEIIDDEMFEITQECMKYWINGVFMTQKDAYKEDAQQFELNLDDERIKPLVCGEEITAEVKSWLVPRGASNAAEVCKVVRPDSAME